ncbi:MAG: hypothetical protein EPN34_10600 [Burkholderiaceae bacterium]|jgi:hypothetical protein|nr:MAG: hypothetical protein EPN34_10600 [Burkholderiaceae bacterium]
MALLHQNRLRVAKVFGDMTDKRHTFVAGVQQPLGQRRRPAPAHLRLALRRLRAVASRMAGLGARPASAPRATDEPTLSRRVKPLMQCSKREAAIVALA